jgi:hypothetical protein
VCRTNCIRQGYAPVVIISAGTQVAEGDEFLPEAEVMRRQAIALEMPDRALLIEDQSQSDLFRNGLLQRGASPGARLRFHSVGDLDLYTAGGPGTSSKRYSDRRSRSRSNPHLPIRVPLLVVPTRIRLCVVLYEYYNWVRYWLGIRLPKEMRLPCLDSCFTRE